MSIENWVELITAILAIVGGVIALFMKYRDRKSVV